MSKIGFCVFGTAGDILPCIAVARALRDAGHSVTFITPRWLGLYSRLAGFSTVSVGDGSEKQALTDTPMYTTRFDGMESWRRCMVDYVYPLVSQNYETFRDEIRRIAPDLIVTTALGYWGALAAVEFGIPWSSFHMYPQLFSLVAERASRFRSHLFARPLAEWLISQENRLGLQRSHVPVLDWSIHPTNTVTGHDPAVLQFAGQQFATVGFPYWDETFANNAAVEEAMTFLARSNSPRIVVSLGSFIGLVDSKFWYSMSKTASDLPYRFLFIGLGESDRMKISAPNICAVSHVPMSRVLQEAEFVVHHGGIGSTYAALNAGIPALVLPHAFDQPYNGRLVHDVGVGGVLGNNCDEWRGEISGLVDGRTSTTAAKDLASRLVSPEDAAVAIAHRLHASASSTGRFSSTR